MDKIQKQGSRIAELIDKGREQGYLTYADVNDHLPEDISDPDQVDEIIGMINDLGLQVHETAPDADTLMLSESSDDDEPSEEEAAPPEFPSKIGVVIVSSIDGKTANVKVPSNMPVNKLLQNCIEKFQLPHSNFAVMLNGAPVDVNLSLADAGLSDSCQIDLVPLE